MIPLSVLRKLIEAAQAIANERGLDAGTRSRYVNTFRLMYAELRTKADDRDRKKLYQLDYEVEAL